MRVGESRLTAAYMMARRWHGTLYLGSALDLIARVWDHKNGVGSKFVRKYASTHSRGSAKPKTRDPLTRSRKPKKRRQ